MDLFVDAGLAPTKSEARRLVAQGWAFVSPGCSDHVAITDVAALIGADALDGEGELLLRAGRKRFCRALAR